MKPGLLKTTAGLCCTLVLLGLCACQQPQTAPGRTTANATPADFEDGSDLPPSPKTLYAAARILGSKGRHAEHESALIRIIKEQPRCGPAYCDLARLRLRHQNLTGAVEALEQGLAVSPEDPVLLNDLGMCRLAANEYPQALRAFTQAASIAPHNHKYRANMAVALALLGRYEESLALYEQVLPPETAAHNLAILRDARRQNPLRTISSKQ